MKNIKVRVSIAIAAVLAAMVTFSMAAFADVTISPFKVNQTIDVYVGKRAKTVTVKCGSDNRKRLPHSQKIALAIHVGEDASPYCCTGMKRLKFLKVKSSNKSVATVSKNGLITVKKNVKTGKTATISVRCKVKGKWLKGKVRIKTTKGKIVKNSGWIEKDAIIQNKTKGLKYTPYDCIYVRLPGCKGNNELEAENFNKNDKWLWEYAYSGSVQGENMSSDAKLAANLTASPKETIVIRYVNYQKHCIPRLLKYGARDFYIIDNYNKMRWRVKYTLVPTNANEERQAAAARIKKYLGTDNIAEIQKKYTVTEAIELIKAGAEKDTDVPDAIYDQKYWQGRRQWMFYEDEYGKFKVNYGCLLYAAGIQKANNASKTKTRTKATYEYSDNAKSNVHWLM